MLSPGNVSTVQLTRAYGLAAQTSLRPKFSALLSALDLGQLQVLTSTPGCIGEHDWTLSDGWRFGV